MSLFAMEMGDDVFEHNDPTLLTLRETGDRLLAAAFDEETLLILPVELIAIGPDAEGREIVT
jgi:hypothetical protein